MIGDFSFVESIAASPPTVVILSNMTATPLIRRRVVLTADPFAEIVVWKVSEPVPPPRHSLKHRLAFVVKGDCMLRYDSERGKGDHRRFEATEAHMRFQCHIEVPT